MPEDWHSELELIARTNDSTAFVVKLWALVERILTKPVPLSSEEVATSAPHDSRRNVNFALRELARSNTFPRESAWALNDLPLLRNKVMHDLVSVPSLTDPERQRFVGAVGKLIRHEGGARLGPGHGSKQNVASYAQKGRADTSTMARSPQVTYRASEAVAHAVTEKDAAETPSELLSRRNQNVDALKEMLVEHLGTEDQRDLIERLRQRGYTGSVDGVFCEYCLDKDPVRILVEHFSDNQLRRILRSRGGDSAPLDSIDEVATGIVALLGFTIPGEPKGIGFVIKQVQQLNSKLKQAGSKNEVIGIITPLTNEIERALHGLVVFYGTVFFGSDYKQEFAKWRKKFGGEKLTLGDRCNLLQRFEKKVQEEALLQLRLKELFRERTFLIGSRELDTFREAVASKRGHLSHFRDRVDRMKAEEVREIVQQVVDQCLAFFTYLQSSGVFPSAIVVDEIVVDKFGRKFLRCVDEEERAERVYTDAEIDPSKQYFLLPLTNPFRIYPHLVQYQEAK
jgi:hypothetical protein